MHRPAGAFHLHHPTLKGSYSPSGPTGHGTTVYIQFLLTASPPFQRVAWRPTRDRAWSVIIEQIRNASRLKALNE